MERLFEPGVKSAIDILRSKGITLKEIEEAYAFLDKGKRDTAEFIQKYYEDRKEGKPDER